MSIFSNSSDHSTIDSANSVECSQSDMKLEQRISQTLKKVFFFAIRSNLLVFVSPNGNDLFEFSRIQKVYLTNLTGTWFLDEIYWQRASNTQVTITKDNFTFCKGKLVATYTKNNIDEIKFSIKEKQGCQQANLTKALNNIAYYRLKDTELELFYGESVEIMQLMFKSGDGLKEQEKFIKEETKVSQGTVTIVQSENPAKMDQSIEQNLRSMRK